MPGASFLVMKGPLPGPGPANVRLRAAGHPAHRAQCVLSANSQVRRLRWIETRAAGMAAILVNFIIKYRIARSSIADRQVSWRRAHGPKVSGPEQAECGTMTRWRTMARDTESSDHELAGPRYGSGMVPDSRGGARTVWRSQRLCRVLVAAGVAENPGVLTLVGSCVQTQPRQFAARPACRSGCPAGEAGMTA